MKTKLTLCFLLSFLLNVSAQVDAERDRCGVFRWPIKTLTDETGKALLSIPASDITFDKLVNIPRPASYQKKSPGDLFRYPAEQQPVKLKAKIVAHKIVSNDNDYHIVLIANDGGDSLIAEIPSPECDYISADEDLSTYFSELRVLYDEIAGRPRKKGLQAVAPIEVEITGIPFFDMENHGKGHAPNGIELHPVTAIRLLKELPLAAVPDVPQKTIPAIVKSAAVSNTPLEPSNLFFMLLIAMLVGMAGQGVRVIVGLNKTEMERDYKRTMFSLFIALVIGGITGILTVINDPTATVSGSYLLALFAAGYAGTDFIEGFMRKNPAKNSVPATN